MLNDADFKQTLKSHINTVCEIFSENIQAICQEYLYNLDDTFKTLENFLATQNFCNVNFCSITHSSTLDIKGI